MCQHKIIAALLCSNNLQLERQGKFLIKRAYSLLSSQGFSSFPIYNCNMWMPYLTQWSVCMSFCPINTSACCSSPLILLLPWKFIDMVIKFVFVYLSEHSTHPLFIVWKDAFLIPWGGKPCALTLQWPRGSRADLFGTLDSTHWFFLMFTLMWNRKLISFCI